MDIPIGFRLNNMFSFGDDSGFIVPEIRAAFVYAADKSRPSIASGFAGTPGSFKMVGVESGHSLNASVGFLF